MEDASTKIGNIPSLAVKLIAYVVLTILLALIIWGWLVLDSMEKKKTQDRFDEYCLEIALKIKDRLHDNAMILRGAAGVFAASDNVSFNDWDAYVKYRNIEELYHGTKALGYARVINPYDLNNQIRSIRSDVDSSFTIWPFKDTAKNVPVIYISPVNDLNKGAIGFNLLSDPMIRSAIEKCRDSAMVTLSGMVNLFQNSNDMYNTGILIFIPIYTQDQPLTTIQDRRKAITGYAFSMVRIDEMIYDLFKDHDQKVTYKIYENDIGDNLKLLYPTSNSIKKPESVNNSSVSKSISLRLYGKNWSLIFHPTPHFDEENKSRLSLVLLISGTIISLLVFFQIRSGERVARRAQKIADRMTASLRMNEERFRSTLDNMMEGCQILDINWTYVYINYAAERQNRRSKEELLGKEYTKMWPGIENTMVYEFIKRCMVERIPQHLENEFTYPDGSGGCFDLSIQPVPEGVFILSIDISDKKKAEISFRESEEKFRSIMENSADSIFIIDRQGNFKYTNKAATELLGFSREEFSNMSILDLTPANQAEEFMNLMKHLLIDGKLFIEIELINNLGHVIPVDFNSVVLPGELVYGSCRNITERKKIENELTTHRLHLEELVKERANKLYLALEEIRDLYDNAPCGYHSLDSTGKFIRINSTELAWLGYSKEEIIEKKFFTDLLTKECIAKFRKNYPEFLKKGSISNLEFDLIRKDGSRFTALVNATALQDTDGNFVMSRSTLFDVTERKEALIALQKARHEAESANRAKSEFLANMSHEIRTPLNAVLGYSELLDSIVTDKLQKNYLNSIKSSGRNLLTLINDILDLSKIEAGKLDLEFDYVDTNTFFSDFEKIFSLKVKEKGLNFVLNISSGTPSGIYIDEARLRQILFNLIGNAVKFTKEGSITVKVYTLNPQLVKYSDEKSEEFIDLLIEVSDTGIGISKELKEKIFEPFTQERSNKHFGGTGLGLTITKRLISLMNGSIGLKTSLGKGSTFIIKIPQISFLREFSSTNIDIKINPSDIVFEEATILIVDDIQHNRNYLKDALKDTKLKILEAGDGIEALKIIKYFVPDLIIADIRMPKMDGFELLNKIKSNKKIKHIPVIAYSASVLKAQKEKIHDSQFIGLLIKPVTVAELYLTLMNVLPYSTVSKGNNINVLKEETVAAEIENLPELIVMLETIFHDRWKTFAVTQPIDEIHQFASDLLQLGLNHNSQIITNYGEELINAADSFNIDALLKLILKYKSVLESLKTLKTT